jgi:hypothetical protein
MTLTGWVLRISGKPGAASRHPAGHPRGRVGCSTERNAAIAVRGLIPDSPGKFAQVYGAYVWAFLLLIGVLAVLLRRGRPARGGDESSNFSPNTG